TVAQPPPANATSAARPRLRSGRRRSRGRSGSRSRGWLLLAIALVIGLAEQIVVLRDVEVSRLELEGTVEHLARLGELALLFQRDPQVVEGLRVLRVEGHRALEAEARLAPEPAARDLDAAPELFLGGGGRLAGGRGEQDDEERQHRNHERSPEPG